MSLSLTPSKVTISFILDADDAAWQYEAKTIANTRLANSFLARKINFKYL